ncbi:MAG: hypothetical protein IK092_07720, partial [Muribaculaceae bacterium]|nr:hypothetical protein [Muribaculaceae bacterium]
IIFNDGKTTGAKQTADLEFINGGYYTIDGLIAAIPGSELPKENEDVFILGEVNNNGGWYPNVGTQMFTKDGITYTANITTTGSNGGYSYFSFSKKLAQAGEGWDAINRYRFGARTDEENLLVTDELLGQELPLDVDGSQKAFQIVAGTWNLTLNLSTRTLVVSYPEELVGDFDSSGCVDIVDLTILINTILDGSTSDFYDVNGDNEVDVRDVTALIALILQ